MKQELLADVIHKYIHHLHTLYERIPGRFDREDIHEWRVGYKKLRTFLRMTDTVKHTPSVFKHLYLAAGQIRDLQLLVNAFQSSENERLPVYLNRIGQELFKAKEAFVSIGDKVSFKKIRKKYESHMPSYLSDEQLQQFVAEKKAGVRVALMTKEDSNSLHTIRKHLKDLLYAVKIYEQEWGLPFPVPKGISEKSLQELSSLAGDYNDLCIQVNFLNMENTSHLPAMELALINRHKAEWVEKKRLAKMELLGKLEAEKL